MMWRLYSILRLKRLKVKFKCNYKAKNVWVCACVCSDLHVCNYYSLRSIRIHLYGLILQRAIKVSCFALCALLSHERYVPFFSVCFNFAISERLAFTKSLQGDTICNQCKFRCLVVLYNWLHSESSEVMKMFQLSTKRYLKPYMQQKPVELPYEKMFFVFFC